MAIKKGYFILSETNEISEGRIDIQTNLPDFIQKKNNTELLASPSGLLALMNLCGMKNLEVVPSSSNATSKINLDTSGVTSSGAGIASGKNRNENVNISSHKSTVSNNSFLSYRSIVTKIEVNYEEIKQKIQNKDSSKLFSSELWSKYLNENIRKGIIKDGSEHLLKNSTPNDYLYSSILYSPILINITNDLINNKRIDLLGNLAFYGGLNVVAFGLLYLQNYFTSIKYKELYDYFGFNYNDDIYRPSLINPLGPQIDRAIVLNVLGRTKYKTLIKNSN